MQLLVYAIAIVMFLVTASFSTDNRILFVSTRDNDYEVYSVLPDGSDEKRLTFSDGLDLAPTWSPDGDKILFFSFRSTPGGQIYSMNHDGSNQVPITQDSTFHFGSPSLSPDGTKIAFNRRRPVGGNQQIYIMDTNGKNMVQLTKDASASNTVPRWSPDGQRILFLSDREGNIDLFLMDADGSNQTNITNSPYNDGLFGRCWSPNGQKIAFQALVGDRSDIYSINLDGTGLINLTNTPDQEPEYSYPSWSPDGTKMVLSKNYAFYPDLYVLDLASGEMEQLTFTDNAGEIEAYWGPLAGQGVSSLIRFLGWGEIKAQFNHP